MSRKLLVGVLAFLVVGAGGAGLYLELGDESASDRAAAEASLAVRPEPVGFPTLEGDTASLADYRGRVVLLNLWGTWCHPCLREIPDLVELQEKIEDRGGTVVGLAVDSGSPEKIRTFARRHGMNYPIWWSSGRDLTGHYRVMGYPTTYLVDRQGVIRERYRGPQTAAKLLDEMEPYLGG